jgi:hypothetical protein
MLPIPGALERGAAVDASKDRPRASRPVRVELGLLNHIIAGFAVDCVSSHR